MAPQCIFVAEDTITTTAIAVICESLMPPQIFPRDKFPIAISTRPAMKSQIMLIEGLEIWKSSITMIAITMSRCFLMLDECLRILKSLIADIADFHFDKIKENQVNRYMRYEPLFTLLLAGYICCAGFFEKDCKQRG